MRIQPLTRPIRAAVFAGALCCLGGLSAPAALAGPGPQPGDVDLSPTPPDLTASVDPNILVTFDDSGSMTSNFMGDDRPFDNGIWGGPWRCAGVIDPRIADPADPRSKAMNGVYYNPNTAYAPPLYEDGSTFPDADANLRAVWTDGIAVKRPANPAVPGAAGLNNNPNSASGANDTRVTNVLGTVVRSGCDKNGNNCKTTDNRWSCGWGTNPLEDNGGPYYYRLKSGTSIVKVDGSIDTGTLYTSANWEAVAVPAAQYQNFANWYAYYRTRNLMTRTALSQVFGKLGDNIRVAWQNINASSWQLPASTVITNLNNTSTDPSARNYRKSFFDWVFQVPASGNTPNRASTIRAGEFFKRGLTTDLKNPFWQPGEGGAQGRNLSCRQNFHMLVTDGYWNEGNPSNVPTDFFTVQGAPTLGDSGDPEANAAFPHVAENRLYWDVPASPKGGSCGSNNSTDCYPSLADIAFYYWAKDLQPALKNNVPPYYPDKSTDLFGVSLKAGDDPHNNKEIFWNPANDPATWQHVVQLMITLGVAGNLDYPKDLKALRTGVNTSLGNKGWPQPSRNAPPAIDDTWHAAVNSRGSYFSAGDPHALVEHLTDIITNILSRRGSSTSLSATMATLTQGTQGFAGGYDTSDWSGYLRKQGLDPATGTPGATVWEAGDLLTRRTAPRVILTGKGGGATGGVNFDWTGLSAAQKISLDSDPAAAQRKLNWLRGDRSNETASPLLRKRSSLLGAIVNSRPKYVSAPTGGFMDAFPSGSPEANAAAKGRSFAQFVYDNRQRPPTVYVGANDGMLHAFNAVDGSERWAYVPDALFGNGKLAELTSTATSVVKPTVDNSPVIQDAFFGGQWRTVLIGSLRLGGRGIFALDITDPDAVKPLWEFSNKSAGGGNLGYTYALPNVVRLNSGKWAVLLSSGYFPKDTLDPASNEAAANRTSLFAIDLESGALLTEVATASALQAAAASYALSTAAAYDIDNDQVDDIAVAGDLAGNLWRFDLRNLGAPKVDLMFKAYGGNSNDAKNGKYPISVMPVAMRDPAAGRAVWIFGTGKYIGLEDRTSTTIPSNIGPQAFFGIRDYGTGSANYPITPDQLQAQTMTQTAKASDGGAVRSLSRNPVDVTAKRGWTIPLDIAAEPGERVVVNVNPFYSINRAVLTTLVPKGDDPCDPGRRGAVMVVDAATGGSVQNQSPILGGIDAGATSPVGKVINSNLIPIAQDSPPPVIGTQDGSAVIPGLQDFRVPGPQPHRGAWRKLLDLL